MEYLAEIYETLTESEKRVFSYIYQNQARSAKMNIQDVAKAAAVSKTVVINMCQKLGFEGFSDFKYYLKSQKSVLPEELPLELDHLQNMILDQVKRTLALINADVFQEASRSITGSKTVYIVGRGTSKAVASYLERMFLMLGIKCINLTDFNLIGAVVENIDINETLIVISLSGETQKALEVARIAKARNAAVISITGFTTNTLSRISDLHLYCAADQVDTKSCDLHSRIGLFVVADILMNFVRQRKTTSIFKS
ncbi:MurR/RpiR family transcriptional regulator [Lachnoclostridium sp. An14]|uniref:MurR/RpiR family transcriptional regulator n=1 Tax=Lachnoclostridium sp. An14 TaxID=1965562 RepID=UPI0013A64FBC|nr:MurR/RpiR family transcriptional regulator [Lachnoclostridium sp. An14]